MVGYLRASLMDSPLVAGAACTDGGGVVVFFPRAMRAALMALSHRAATKIEAVAKSKSTTVATRLLLNESSHPLFEFTPGLRGIEVMRFSLSARE